MSKLNLKLSNHAKSEHQDEKWNAVTIAAAYQDGRLTSEEFYPGKTADVLCGWIDGDYVGLVLSKPAMFGPRVIITGFAAPKEYWENV